MPALAANFEQTLRTVRIRELALTPPLEVQRGSRLRDVISRMQDAKRPCAIVCDGKRVAGIFTERDILYKLTAPGASLDRPVDEVMTASPATLSPEAPVSQAITMMTEQSYRHIPLVDGDRNLAGYVTARDVIVYIAEHFPTEVFNLPPRLHQTATRAEGG